MTANLVEWMTRIVTRGVVLFVVLAILLRPGTSRGSIAEQRNRLPSAAHCEDPIVGEWKAHQYNDVWKQWVIFRLIVRRKPGSPTELIGQIFNETWSGRKADQEPGPCSEFVTYRTRTSMPDAFGSYRDGQVAFGATAYVNDGIVCGKVPQGFGYLPDHFTGPLDEERQEFQSRNNDGGRAVNEPTLFRRVQCFDGPTRKVPVDVVAPPFVPPERSGGC